MGRHTVRRYPNKGRDDSIRTVEMDKRNIYIRPRETSTRVLPRLHRYTARMGTRDTVSHPTRNGRLFGWSRIGTWSLRCK